MTLNLGHPEIRMATARTPLQWQQALNFPMRPYLVSSRGPSEGWPARQRLQCTRLVGSLGALSDITAAMEKAIEDGVDVRPLSIGSNKNQIPYYSVPDKTLNSTLRSSYACNVPTLVTSCYSLCSHDNRHTIRQRLPPHC
ncbi:hypothetical protein AAC387_Pa01g3859 [Persea americana]